MALPLLAIQAMIPNEFGADFNAPGYFIERLSSNIIAAVKLYRYFLRMRHFATIIYIEGNH
jgi:hypothetical protein